jgi:hypothetical protein
MLMPSTSETECNCPQRPSVTRVFSSSDSSAFLNQYTPHVFSSSFSSSFSCSELILFLFFSQQTPLHLSAWFGHLEICRLLVESKADVAARAMCFSPSPSHHLSLTICLAAMATLHSNAPSTATKPTSLHTCAASARLSDAPPRAAAAAIKAVLVRVAAAVWGPP